MGAAHPVAHTLAIQASRECYVCWSMNAQARLQRPVSDEHEAMRATPREHGGRPGQVVHPLEAAEGSREQDDGLLARFCRVWGGRPPVRVHALIVHAQSLRISARAQRDVRQVPGDSQQPTRALEGGRAVMRVPRGPRAPPEPRVGVPAVQSHHEGRARLPRGADGRQRPRRLMLVDNVRAPRGDRAAHLAQASRLRGHANGERAAERAGRGLVDGDHDGWIGDACREREDPPIELRHREGVREREVGRGNQQGSLRQGDPHECHPRAGADR